MAIARRGFTVVELMIVIGIIGIIAAIAVPAITTSLKSSELDTSARQLEADLRWMQQLSVNSGNVNIPDIHFANAAPFGYYISINGTVKKTVTFPDSVRLNSPPAAFAFGINGYLSTPVTISLQSGSTIRQVIVDIAGRIRVN